MDRNANLSVSFGDKLRYCRGSLYAIIYTVNVKKFYNLCTLKKVKLILNYARYSIHSDLNYSASKNKWVISKGKKNYFFYFFLSYLICIGDHLLGKVEKTHREFDLNKKKYKVTDN